MKRTILIAALLIGMIGTAQTVNGIPLKDIDVTYVQIVGKSKNMTGTKLTITLDFGQVMKFSGKTTLVKNSAGKQIIFNSMMDALNFMIKYDYEFVNSNYYSMGNSQVAHFMLKKIKL